jgi:transcriptional regulator with XRE-family HTH domain
MNFGLAIGALRRMRGVLPEELAERVGRKVYSIIAIEASRETLTVSAAAKLAQTLGSNLGVLEQLAIYLDTPEVKKAISDSQRPLHTLMSHEEIVERMRTIIG